MRKVLSKKLVEIRRWCHFKNNHYFGNLKQETTVCDKSTNVKLRDEDSLDKLTTSKFLIDEFRKNGHFLASLNPLQDINEVDEYNIKCSYKLRNYINNNLQDEKYKSLIDQMQIIYCKEIGIEFMHIDNLDEREWIGEKWEMFCNEFNLNDKEKKRISDILIRSEVFDEFVSLKFPTIKRYGAEGCEPMLTFFDEIFCQASKCCDFLEQKQNDFLLNEKIDEVIVGMPHRGRLNFLSILMNFPEKIIFRKMQGKSEFDLNRYEKYTGDVLSHLFHKVDLAYNNNNIRVDLLPNPSHLETISPVVCGKTRAKLLSRKYLPYYKNSLDGKKQNSILCVQVHGDASFSGQGIIYEQLQFSQFANFSNFGTIHLVVNNQIGYTTENRVYDETFIYNTNIMRSINCPILHVNSFNPEELVKATRFALKYREIFKKDVLINLICFRKHGHNELDDPTFTNPKLYNRIKNLNTSIPMKYSLEKAQKKKEDIFETKLIYKNHLNKQLEESLTFKLEKDKVLNNDNDWENMKYTSRNLIQEWDTGVNERVLKYIGLVSLNVGKKFNLHKNLNKIFHNRLKSIKEGIRIDWSLSECLAFGSLMYQGFNVRLSGQDVGRGTFSQRHMMIVDQQTNQIYIPLNLLALENVNIEGYLKKLALDNTESFKFELDFNEENHNKKCNSKVGQLEIANSILSEEGVLAFEYGFSIESANNLVIWEAQFGDFFNGAQTIFDTLICTGENKWGQQSGLVCLLPHGLDGAGPEHSSCRIERFLQMTNSNQTAIDSDSVNIHIAYPTTPSQYFHLLRRQMMRNYRKPLIVASAKLLLRHEDCFSSLDDFSEGNSFKKIICDGLKNKKLKKIIFCCGKVYYNLKKYSKENNINNIGIIRIEELCPFPAIEISEALKVCHFEELVWCQEEHRNQGAWDFVYIRFKNILKLKLKYVGRDVSSVPAVGIGNLHKKETEQIITKCFNS